MARFPACGMLKATRCRLSNDWRRVSGSVFFDDSKPLLGEMVGWLEITGISNPFLKVVECFCSYRFVQIYHGFFFFKSSHQTGPTFPSSFCWGLEAKCPKFPMAIPALTFFPKRLKHTKKQKIVDSEWVVSGGGGWWGFNLNDFL